MPEGSFMSRPDTTQNVATGMWLTVPRPNLRAKLRLFCFPYAGGSALVYRDWVNALPDFAELYLVQLPGRGRLMKEPPITRYKPLIAALTAALLPCLDKPFAFFGHSMGATIAFELSRRLRRERGVLPVCLFVSGSAAPHLPDRHPRTFDLPETEFIEDLRRLNGTPQEVLEHPELMEMMMPVLRADFELVQTYVYTDAPPFDCPITAFGGIQDALVPRADLEAWRGQTSAAFTLHMLPGDHFFLHTAQHALLQVASEALYHWQIQDRHTTRPRVETNEMEVSK
jgi:medium-chain acyl-[acyl-carrier-protein] hydrolase